MVIEVDSTIKSSFELMAQFQKLQVATGWLGTVPDLDSAKDLGIDASFSDAYIEKPREDFLEEWNFFAKTSDEDMPLGIMVNEKSLSLYDSTT